MQNFQKCVNDCELQHLPTIGPLFTWYNKRPNDVIEKRLDRMLGNGDWISSFTEGFVKVLPRRIMDHSPLLYSVPMQLQKIHKSFQFFNFMCEHENFHDVIRIAWNEPWYGDPMAILCRRLRNTKVSLIKLNKANENLHNKVHLARKNLVDIQERLSQTSSAQLLDLEQNACKTLESCLLQEEVLLQQKSRVKWLSLGDDNNSFFHNKVKSNWNMNKILAIQDISGAMVFGHHNVSQVAIDYFTSTLGTPSNQAACDLSQLDFSTVTEAHTFMLEAPVTLDFILATLK
ncbi:uncharacterized protein LOC141690658 [Apium graveolens]|uniref:uncharacterized protein LOC141690658 n=1 Tax=Apium graveolens TaxID=4045 RepID=UPI003D7AF040